MCGIYGILSPNGDNVSSKMQTMSSETYHRGPDDQAWTIINAGKAHVGLGINRLAIIDVHSGNQPIYNEDDSMCIVFNGEIYNHDSLRTELIAKGHVFKTQSDTETILHLYEEYGADCVQHLRGMFAFCIYDKTRRCLFIARDHAGIKPLYWYNKAGTFCFGSEIKAITAVTGRGNMNPAAVVSYFTYRYIPGPNTIWQDIRSLPPGRHMTYHLDSGKVEFGKWWGVNITPVMDDYETAKRRVAELLQDAVRVRLQSEVPLGSYLSGGVDSSLIATIAHNSMADTLNVYNIGYQEANEYGYAASLSRMKGFDYYQVAMGFEDMAGILDDVLATMDQPLSDAACFPTLHLSRIVKRRLTVMLSGEGADELFSGYWQYQGIMDSRSPTDTGREAMLDHMRRSSYYLDQMGVIEPGYAVKYNPLTAAEAAWSNGNDPRLLQRVTRFDIDTWLADDLLMKVDKMSMGASIEARVPFLDRYLMEYVLGLPDEYKYSNGTTKRILKDVAEDLGVPSDITRRPKMGFTVPIHSLLQGPFKARFLESLPAVKALPYIRGRVVDQIVRDYYAGRSELSLFCWVLFVFAAWYEKETHGA